VNYKIPNHILDIIMPIVKATPDLSPAKAIEQAILEYYKNHEDNVCQPKDSKK
jgi:DNA-directed RNA polymerase subunit L